MPKKEGVERFSISAPPELLREFDKVGDAQKTHPESEGFFARVKEFFEDLRE